MRVETENKSIAIRTLAARARRRKGGGAAAARFVAQFYRDVAEADLAAAGDRRALGGAMSIWDLLRTRERGKPNIRVFNPDIRADGWTSPHTVVDIVSDDMPFLVDSVTAEINRQNFSIHLVVHPIVAVERDRAGRLRRLCANGVETGAARAESVMHFEITELRRPDSLERLRRGLQAVLGDVRAAVEDFDAMQERLADAAADLESAPAQASRPEIAEAGAFLRWLDDSIFTFIGYREYDFARQGGSTRLKRARAPGLGILRNPARSVLTGWRDGAVLPEVAAYCEDPRPLSVSKANGRSPVHRSVHLDTVMVKKFTPRGRVAGVRIFVGLFTPLVHRQSLSDIPMLARKAATVVARSGFPPDSHNGMSLLQILESLPRSDLFQYSDDDLLKTALGVLQIRGSQKVALFARRDAFNRFVSCLIYVPRERYTAQLRGIMREIVEQGFGARVSVIYLEVSDEAHARLQFIVPTPAGRPVDFDLQAIEKRLAEAGSDWRDAFSQALAETHGEAEGLEVYELYEDAFPASYRERHGAGQALTDIAKIESVLRTGAIAADLWRPAGLDAFWVHFRIYHPDEQLPLSDVLPMLENTGLRVIGETAHRIVRKGAGRDVWLHDFAMQTKDRRAVDLDRAKGNFEAQFVEVWRGGIENDGFNALALATGLHWRQVAMLRAYCKYLRQAAIPFSQAYMEETLLANPEIAEAIVELFGSIFDPDTAPRGAGASDRRSSRRSLRIRNRLAAALDAVEDLDQDRILRRYLNLVLATLRTNYYQRGADGAPKPYIAFKIDSNAVEDLPRPAPMFEIFVYAPRMEAIHLRGGKVARGGIRWSDRREDFRTEILGLMKAQMTKNAVIVPTGAKGGFVVKRPPPPDAGRDAFIAEGIACYRTMISGLLDLTDNITPGGPVHPERVVRCDGDDPYLVVAADKGTASFSDIANEVARLYGFWLDDAFASGGSIGYDHKGMGITARGAWESVKRHFRELGTDIQASDFTCVGIGDMSGDVFGNGMLLSGRIKLVGAFNHLHIFVDPDPDPAAGLAERKRLFELPRSAWTDYDAKSISPGGGVFERHAKAIAVTPEMRRALDLPPGDSLTPNALIQALLRAPVDLLWFGGIGTYVKAPGETHQDVGDRVNDPVRVDADALRCRVVGEGANLGFTQRGRIAYALGGGRINADFIDNSGGVSTSDREVNIKILLGEALAAGRLSRAERDRLLAEMTDEVARQVLGDNYRQSMALTHFETEGGGLIGKASRLIRALERAGHLDRGFEFLPDDETLDERKAAGLGLTRPELAVLLSYAKLTLYDDILASDIPDDPSLIQDAGYYFPPPIRAAFGDLIPGHRLRREISATYVTNSMTNRAGPTFVREAVDQTGAAPAEVVKAYLISRRIFDLSRLWREIEALDNIASAAVQTRLNLDILRLIERSTIWLLRNGPQPLEINLTIERFAGGIGTLAKRLDRFIAEETRAEIEREARHAVEAGVPEPLAREIARLEPLYSGCDIVRIATGRKRGVEDVARVYFTIGQRLGLDWLRRCAAMLPAETEWQGAAAAAVVDDFYVQQSELTLRILDAAGRARDPTAERWWTANQRSVSRAESVIADLRAAGNADLAMLTVANREIRSLIARPSIRRFTATQGEGGAKQTGLPHPE